MHIIKLYLMGKTWTFFFFLLFNLLCFNSFSQSQLIQDFTIKESLLGNKQIAIIATDSTGVPNPQISGVQQFSINGFKYALKFQDGAGLVKDSISESTFLRIKHTNSAKSIVKLYYVKLNENSLKPIYIPWYWLLIVPLFLIFVMYTIRKLLFVGLFFLAAFFYFNYKKGLDLSSLFETISHGILSLFN